MKKFFTAALALVIMLGAMIPAGTVYAATCDWTDGYYDFLLQVQRENQQSKNDFTQYALYDTNGNGIPELILKNSSLEGSYKIYRYADSQVVHERNLSASTFYETDKGEFVVAYGDVAGTTYVYYDGEKTIATSEQMFRSRRDRQISATEWEWVYFYKNKEISKEEFDERMNNEIMNVALVFSTIGEANMQENVLMGLGYPSASNMLFYAGEKNNAGTNATIRFLNGSVESKKDGEDLIYGLLMVDGVFVTDIFPVEAGGATFVPARAVSEGLNASIGWVGELQKINLQKGQTLIEMYVDENFAIVNGERMAIDAAPMMVDGSVYVPVRFVSENLNADVSFYAGEGDLLPIISIGEKIPEDYKTLDEYDAAEKAKFLMKNIDWTAGKSIFSRGFMDNKISINAKELILGRYWLVSVDTNESQYLLIDKYTAHVYSMYTYGNEFGVQPGIDGIVDAMMNIYR